MGLMGRMGRMDRDRLYGQDGQGMDSMSISGTRGRMGTEGGFYAHFLLGMLKTQQNEDFYYKMFAN